MAKVLNKLKIPGKIHVGFQNRKGTYTGRLAFIIRSDSKGKKYCERSWNSWRDSNIPVEDFVNEPLSGFVLNKKVGDYSSSWGGRRAWIRIYDPRGFEFEIKVENLLFILEECSAIKGKGLEGEFIYSWDGKNIVLLPVTSQEYVASKAHNVLQAKKVTKDEMVEGCIYKTKDGVDVMYLGRHNWYYSTLRHVRKDPNTCKECVAERKRRYYGYPCYHTNEKITNHHAKRHIFVGVSDTFSTRSPDYRDDWHTTIPYWIQTGFTKLGERLTQEPDPSYAEAYDKLMSARFMKKPETKKKKQKETTGATSG